MTIANTKTGFQAGAWCQDALHGVDMTGTNGAVTSLGGDTTGYRARCRHIIPMKTVKHGRLWNSFWDFARIVPNYHNARRSAIGIIGWWWNYRYMQCRIRKGNLAVVSDRDSVVDR